MNDGAIGVFDSGIGGLTTVKRLKKLMPNENIVYFGDTGRIPYGNKSEKIIKKYAQQIVNFLKLKNIKIIVAACGTVSSVLGDIAEIEGIPYFGALVPACQQAIKATKNKRISLIGTARTVAGGVYRNIISKIDPEIAIFEKACPLFVPLVENGHTGEKDKILNEVINHYLSEFAFFDTDTLILGCTHYPLIADSIKNFLGAHINIINAGSAVADNALIYLKENDLFTNRDELGKCSFYVSDDSKAFEENAVKFMDERNIGNIEMIDISRY